MRPILFLLFLSLMPACVYSQGMAGARSAGLAGSSVTLDDAWSVFNNQAGMAFTGATQAGVFYESRFVVSELGDKGFALVQPFGSGSFGVSFRSFGYSLYSSSRAGLAYAIKLDEKFSVGVQANYHTLRIAEGYGSQSTLSIEGGMCYRMNEHLTLAAHIFNPTRAQLADYNNERIPGVIRAGASYAFSGKLRILGEMRKPSDQNPVISGGIEYQPVEEFTLRVGAGSNPASTSFGFGWQVGRWRLDVAAAYHAVLGFSPQVALVYSGKKKTERKAP